VPELDLAETSERLAVVAAMTMSTVEPVQRARLWTETLWIHPSRLESEAVQAQLRVLSAAARRDWAETLSEAAALLGSEELEQLHPIAREQILAFASLASIATGGSERAAELEREYGGKVVSASIDDVRSMVLSWGASEQVCSGASGELTTR
jgi:hypothetical protein